MSLFFSSKISGYRSCSNKVSLYFCTFQDILLIFLMLPSGKFRFLTGFLTLVKLLYIFFGFEMKFYLAMIYQYHSICFLQNDTKLKQNFIKYLFYKNKIRNVWLWKCTPSVYQRIHMPTFRTRKVFLLLPYYMEMANGKKQSEISFCFTLSYINAGYSFILWYIFTYKMRTLLAP